MTRDIQDRLELFGSTAVIHRIALVYDQIEQYNPPPNPAKTTDARYQSYADKYGDESWELDALEPSVIVDLIREAVQDRHRPGRLGRGAGAAADRPRSTGKGLAAVGQRGRVPGEKRWQLTSCGRGHRVAGVELGMPSTAQERSETNA